MTKIIDGKIISAAFKEKIAVAVSELNSEHGITPGLAVILVGDDPASDVYVRMKGVETKKAGMVSREYRLAEDASETELLSLIGKLNADQSIDGILLQSPVPDQINYQAVVDIIDPEKDVDGFHPENAGNLLIGSNCFVACTPLGCSIMLKQTLGDLTGMDAIVVGRSTIVGKPMALLLLEQHCTVTIAHSRTKDLDKKCAAADIVVAAVGRPEMIKKDWVKKGATVIDVGINRIGTTESGKAKLVGDVAYDEVVEIAGAITPVPGGVGPMTIACLMYNALKAACDRRGLPIPDIFDEFL